jgi:acyl-CoA thioester hydrolase
LNVKALTPLAVGESTLSPEGRGYTLFFTATPADIDELGHVNNAVWVRWVQEISVAHWRAVATAEQDAAYFWVIVRHEIDYRGNIRADETITAQTWVAPGPQGAKWDRHVAFVKDGKAIVRAVSTWAILDKATQRILRVPADVAARFLPPSGA